MKPVCLPIGGSPSAAERDEGRGLVVSHGGFDFFVVALALGEHALVVGRHDFDELAEHPRPGVEDPRRDGRARVRVMQLDELAELRDILVLLDRLEPYRAEIAARPEIAARIPDARDAAPPTSPAGAAGGAEDHRAPARHVLAAVVADAFDDRARAAVTHAEALGRAAAEERASAGRAVQRDVADQHVLLGLEAAFARRVDDQPAAGEALA